MLPALALGALSAGGAFLSAMGQKNAAAKTWRLQQMENARVDQINRDATQLQNEASAYYGQKLLETPMHESTHTLNFIDIPGFMHDAERAGFNPATFLNSGALGMYHSQQVIRNSTGHNAADAYKMMLPNASLAVAGQVPAQHSSLSAFGGALSAGASAFGTQYRADQSYDLQMTKLLGALSMQGMGLSQSNGLATTLSFGNGGGGGLAGGGGGGLGGATSANGLTYQGQPYIPGAVEGNAKLNSLPYFAQWGMDDGKNYVANPWSRAFVDPYVANVDAQQKRYGEPGEWLFAPDVMFHDLVRNVSGRSIRDWGVAAGMDIGSYKLPTDTSWEPSFGRWWNSPTSLPGMARTQLKAVYGDASPYVPPGMPASIAYPSWARP